ncbi:unnamed protein product [Ranitomeya imitator]|uniref:Peptidase M12A domain-containing protein n=1 Tax=Ranitomeya imitator TaxID=111125 RepID=A0ABN9M7V6_9NEOB|nr:unnamed protein product [Ranitomeya imitator]
MISGYAYSKNNILPTIVPKPDPSVPIGQRSGMSSLDVKKINANYGCIPWQTKVAETVSGLFQVPSMKVVLLFNYLKIASTDYVKVYDGFSKSSPVLLDRTYGSGLISPLVSSGRNMLVEFVNTASSVSNTFTASYITVPASLPLSGSAATDPCSVLELYLPSIWSKA